MKLFIIAAGLVLSFSSTLLARNWSSHLQESYVEVEVDTRLPLPMGVGETVELTGHVCVKKQTPNSKCQLLTPEDLSKYDLKFYYPDVTKDITASVVVILEEDRHEFSFETSETQSGDHPSFIVRLSQKGSKTELYEKALLKLRALREKLLAKRSKWPADSKKIQNLLQTLNKIEEKTIAKIIAEDAVIAKRNWPIQVNNNIANNSLWLNAFETWQLEVTTALGVSFEGEKTWLDTTLTPYLPSDDNTTWKVTYSLDGVELESQLVMCNESLS